VKIGYAGVGASERGYRSEAYEKKATKQHCFHAFVHVTNSPHCFFATETTLSSTLLECRNLCS